MGFIQRLQRKLPRPHSVKAYKRFQWCGICSGFFGTVFLIVAILAPTAIRHLIERGLNTELQLTPDNECGEIFQKWLGPEHNGNASIKTDGFIAVKNKLHMYNITNPFEIVQGAVPIIEEVGPFIYDQYDTRFNYRWLNNDEEIQFQTHSLFLFNREDTLAATDGRFGTDEVNITSIGMAFLGAAKVFSQQPADLPRQLLNYVWSVSGGGWSTETKVGQLFPTRTVREHVFGYEYEDFAKITPASPPNPDLLFPYDGLLKNLSFARSTKEALPQTLTTGVNGPVQRYVQFGGVSNRFYESWSAWQPWSSCSVACGGGNRTRVRTCVGGSECVGTTAEYLPAQKPCNDSPCPSTPAPSAPEPVLPLAPNVTVAGNRVCTAVATVDIADMGKCFCTPDRLPEGSLQGWPGCAPYPQDDAPGADCTKFLGRHCDMQDFAPLYLAGKVPGDVSLYQTTWDAAWTSHGANISSPANEIAGYTGGQYPAGVTSDDSFDIFLGPFARSVNIDSDGTKVEHNGIDMIRFKLVADTWLNCSTFAGNCAYNMDGPSGFWTVEKPAKGLQTRVSNPHFCGVDPQPKVVSTPAADCGREEAGTVIDIEPITGLAMNAWFRLQTSVIIEPLQMCVPPVDNPFAATLLDWNLTTQQYQCYIEDNDGNLSFKPFEVWFPNVSSEPVPLLWSETGAMLDKDNADKFKSTVYGVFWLGTLARFLSVALSPILIIIACYCAFVLCSCFRSRRLSFAELGEAPTSYGPGSKQWMMEKDRRRTPLKGSTREVVITVLSLICSVTAVVVTLASLDMPWAAYQVNAFGGCKKTFDSQFGLREATIDCGSGPCRQNIAQNGHYTYEYLCETHGWDSAAKTPSMPITPDPTMVPVPEQKVFPEVFANSTADFCELKRSGEAAYAFIFPTAIFGMLSAIFVVFRLMNRIAVARSAVFVFLLGRGGRKTAMWTALFSLLCGVVALSCFYAGARPEIGDVNDSMRQSLAVRNGFGASLGRIEDQNQPFQSGSTAMLVAVFLSSLSAYFAAYLAQDKRNGDFQPVTGSGLLAGDQPVAVDGNFQSSAIGIDTPARSTPNA